MTATATLEVKTAADLANQPEEYRAAVKKIVISHAVNELYGAQVFDEPAIALGGMSVLLRTEGNRKGFPPLPPFVRRSTDRSIALSASFVNS